MKANPTLEGLPMELKIFVLLEVPDADTLKSLVLASPEYHQAYLTMRQKILERLVKRQYSGFLNLAEAITAVRSESVQFSRGVENVVCLLDNWRRRDEIRQLNQFSSNQAHEPNGLEEIIKLFYFHKTLRFFLEDYSINAPRPPWIEPTVWKSKYLTLKLSPTEKDRFLRAVCRLQTVSNIFGDVLYSEDPCCNNSRVNMNYWKLAETDELRDLTREQSPWFLEETAYRLFYGTIPPWEHEEMGGVFRYFVAKIEAIYQEIADNLRQLSESTPCEFFWDILPIEERPPPSEVESERDLVHFPQHFEGLAGLGPNFLYRVLHMDRLSRRNIICKNIRGFWQGPFVGIQIGLSWDEKFPFTDPAARHESPKFEQLWSTLPPIEQPTMGWKKSWLLTHNEHDILEDSLDLDRKAEKDWEWGYALWDERRLNEWKAPLLNST